MYRHTLFMLLTAFVSCGIIIAGVITAFPGAAFALGPMNVQADTGQVENGGPMLARGNAQDPAAMADSAFAEDAFTVLFNTERLMHARRDRGKTLMPAPLGADLAEDAFTVLFNTERVMLSRDDDDLSQIHGAGPRMAPRRADSSKDDAVDGPRLAQDSTRGPMLAVDDAGGPVLAVEDEAGPAIDAPADAPAEDPVAPAADTPPAEIPRDQEVLYREVRELREMVDQLREEAEARERLRVTDEEARDEETEILEAAGREYTLRQPGIVSLNFSMNYSYNDYDVIRQIQQQQGTRIEHRYDHNITNTFSFETGLRNNLSLDASIPFVYKYDKVDTAQSRDTTNLGDASLGLKYQPFKSGRGYPAPIFSVDYTWPTGKSPFDIDQATELSTGSGFHQVSGGVSVSHPFDPVNAFASLRYRHYFKETGIGQSRGRGTLDEVDPGDRISASLGFGYAVSYRMSMSLSLSTSYSFSTDYYWLARDGRDKTSSGDSVGASLGLNTSWRVTPRRTVIIGIGKGLTTANPGFSFSARLPFSLDRR